MRKELRDYIENATIGKVDIQQCQYGYSVIVFTIKDENDESTIDELYDEIGNYVCTSIAHGDNYVFSNKKQVAYQNTIDYIFEPEQMNEYIDDLKKQDDFIVITSNASSFADSLIKKYEEEYEDVYEDAFQMWVENIEFELYRGGISKEYVKMLYNYIYSN